VRPGWRLVALGSRSWRSAVENICLQAVALDLGTTVVGAFTDDQVKKVVGMAEDEQPLAIVPVGKAAP